jgi:Nuclease-related domain
MPAPATPDPSCPWEDHDQAPGLSIRPLGHADLRAFLAEWDDDEPPLRLPPAARPPGAARRPAEPALATGSQPGRSAQAQYRRRRAAELAAWMATLPLRLAATIAAGVAAGLVGGSTLGPSVGVMSAVAAAVVVGWRLRFRPSPETVAWRRGALGEERTAALLGRLERQGWTALHDLAVPGSAANLDHLVVGPGGVFVVDSKHYRGLLRLTADATLWHGRHPLTATLGAVRFEADRAAQVLAVPGVAVAPVVAVHGAPVPWGTLVVGGVSVVAARQLTDWLRARPTTLSPARVAWLAERARQRFRPAT